MLKTLNHKLLQSVFKLHIGVLCISFALGMGLYSNVQTAQAAPTAFADGIYTIKAVNSGKCLEPVGASAGGANLWQEPCVAGGTHQQWQFVSVGSGYYKIANLKSSLSMSVLSSSTADTINIWQTTDANLASQKWKPVLQWDGSYQLVAAHSNKCAGIISSATYDGATLLQYLCSTLSSQRFILTAIPPMYQPSASPLADGFYTLKVLHSNKCIESPAAATLVQQGSCGVGLAKQQWHFVPLSDGYYKVINANGGQVLSVDSSSTNENANVWQWSDLGLNNQKWLPVLQSDGSYLLVAFHSNKCATVANAGFTDGTLLWQNTCSTVANQRFTIEDANVRRANLSLTKSAALSKITIGESFAYVLTVTNNGPDPAVNVTVTDELPTGTRIDSVTASSGGVCSTTASVIKCIWSSLANKSSATITVNITP